MGPSDTLSSTGLCHRSTLTVRRRVLGGVDPPHYKRLDPDSLPQGVVLSSSPDVITQEDDKDGVPRAALPCGHAISANSMSAFLSQFAFRADEYEVRCPAGSQCGKVIPWELAQKVGSLFTKYQLRGGSN